LAYLALCLPTGSPSTLKVIIMLIQVSHLAFVS
jgi:hypothetical protein